MTNAELGTTRPPSYLDRIAVRKLDAPSDWEHFKWECIGDTDDLLVTGGVPRPFKSGPNKGRRNWVGKSQTVCITQAEQDAEYFLYEAETGNCHQCGDTGQEWRGWSATNGNMYKPCKRCAGTGKAPAKATGEAA